MTRIGPKCEHGFCTQDAVKLAHMVGYCFCQIINFFDSNYGDKIKSATNR